MENNVSLSVDVREIAKEYFSVHVQYKGRGWLKLGLWFLKIGCWIGGFQLVDEFPMSLIQPGNKQE